MFELSLFQYLLVIFCAIFIGFTKTGLPSLGILVVTILMSVFPARESVGILLPMLVIGDLFAVMYYRRNVVWKYLFNLLPWVLLGIISGYFVLEVVTSEQLKPIVGIIVIGIIVLHLVQERLGEQFNRKLPHSLWFTSFMGIMGGFTTMVGNASGGVMAIYFLVKGLPKQEFVGTGAWFFLTVNIIKLPFYIYMGLVNAESLTFNLWMFPIILFGAFIGVRMLHLLPQRMFQILILLFAAFGGIQLLF